MLTVKEKLYIVRYYKTYGHLNSKDCKAIGKHLGVGAKYLETVKSRKWFDEYCEIWDIWHKLGLVKESKAK